MYHHDIEFAANARNRHDVAEKIEIELVVERRVDGGSRTDRKERIAIWRRPHDGLGSNIATAAWPIFDDEWLAEPLRQPLADETREDVVRTARCNWDDDTNWPCWIGLRPREARHDRARSGACCQMQKLTAGKFHGLFSGAQLAKTRYR